MSNFSGSGGELPKLQMILSPAKTMDFSVSPEADAIGKYEAVGSEQVEALANVLSTQSVDALKKTLSVSTALAEENYERYQNWKKAERRQAIVAYDGFAYAKLQGRSLSSEEMKYAHSKLIMVSGMWGPVRALTGIKPYRLEMACKNLPKPYAKLADYWRETVTKEILEGFSTTSSAKDRVLVNVASDEYAAAVDFAALRAADIKVIKVNFYQAGRKAPTIHLKFGRGLLARYIIQNRIDDLAALQSFDLEGYTYSPHLSNDETITFSREAPPPPAKTKKIKKPIIASTLLEKQEPDKETEADSENNNNHKPPPKKKRRKSSS